MIKFFNRRKAVSEKRTVYYSELKIFLRNKTDIGWRVELENKFDYIKPFRIFYKWYFSKTGKYFVMKYRGGESMVSRDEIVSFDRTYGSRVVEKK